jgi:hypothetical protein
MPVGAAFGAAAALTLVVVGAYSFVWFLANDKALDCAGFKWYKLWRNKYVGLEVERGNLRNKISEMEDDNFKLWSENSDLKGQVKYLEADNNLLRLKCRGKS